MDFFLKGPAQQRKCPKCEEEGNQTKTKGGEEHWEKITTKIARIKEKEGLTLMIEEFLEVHQKT